MADIIWSGALAPVAQKDEVTLGAVSAGTSFSLKSGSTTITYVAVSGDVTADVLNELVAAAGSAGREWQDISVVNSGDTKLVCTSVVSGVPYNLVNVTNCTVTNITAATGPNHWAAGNFQGGVLPASADRAIFQNSDISLLYNLDTTLSNILLVFDASYTGTVGLPRDNPNGYVEYRERALIVGTPSIVIGRGTGDGSSFIYIDGDATSGTVITIYKTGAAGDETNAVALRNFADAVIMVLEGSVSLGPYEAGAMTVAELRAAGSSVIEGGITAVVDDLFVSDSASVTLYSLTGDTVQRGGDVVVLGTGATANVDIYAGSFTWQSTGNVTSLDLLGESALFSTSAIMNDATTITTLVMQAGTFLDPNARAAITNFTPPRNLVGARQ